MVSMIDTARELHLLHPFTLVFIGVGIYLLNTYLTTRTQFLAAIKRLQSAPGPPPPLPYFLPLLGHAPGIVPSLHTFIKSKADANPSLSCFGIKLFGTRHNIVLAPSVTHQILTGRGVPVSMHELILRVIETVWGDRKKFCRSLPSDFIWDKAHKVISGLMRETFVTKALSVTVSGIQDRILNLVSGNHSIVDQSVWERTAKVSNVEQGFLTSPAVDADLYPLLRDFVGHLAIDVFMGTDFNANFPNALPDLWQLDNNFTLYMTGFPDWLPPLTQSTLARNRLIEAVRQHRDASLRSMNGQDPGPTWANIDNASNVVKERATIYATLADGPNARVTRKDMLEESARADASVIWAMNANANQVIYWVIFYVYSDPKLLAELRAEIAPYITVTKPSTGLPIEPQPDIKIDLDGLRNHCPLLQATFLETMRVEATFLSYKYVEEDFEVTESAEDAKLFNHEKPYTYIFQKGEYICMPGSTHQVDPRYWTDPHIFNPRRFWSTGKEPKSKYSSDPVADDTEIDDTKPQENLKQHQEQDVAKVKIDYQTLKVWGGGKEVCKGRKFAEGEVLLFTAALIHFWSFTPLDRHGREQSTWTHPGSVEAAGARHPKKNLRVRCRRREGVI